MNLSHRLSMKDESLRPCGWGSPAVLCIFLLRQMWLPTSCHLTESYAKQVVLVHHSDRPSRQVDSGQGRGVKCRDSSWGGVKLSLCCTCDYLLEWRCGSICDLPWSGIHPTITLFILWEGRKIVSTYSVAGFSVKKKFFFLCYQTFEKWTEEEDACLIFAWLWW